MTKENKTKKVVSSRHTKRGASLFKLHRSIKMRAILNNWPPQLLRQFVEVEREMINRKALRVTSRDVSDD